MVKKTLNFSICQKSSFTNAIKSLKAFTLTICICIWVMLVLISPCIILVSYFTALHSRFSKLLLIQPFPYVASILCILLSLSVLFTRHFLTLYTLFELSAWHLWVILKYNIIALKTYYFSARTCVLKFSNRDTEVFVFDFVLLLLNLSKNNFAQT